MWKKLRKIKEGDDDPNLKSKDITPFASPKLNIVENKKLVSFRSK